jgi:hypothetical protein
MLKKIPEYADGGNTTCFKDDCGFVDSNTPKYGRGTPQEAKAPIKRRSCDPLQESGLRP